MADEPRIFKDRYRELRQIGSGGFAGGAGGVFLAESIDPERTGPQRVAIKVVPETHERLFYLEKFRAQIQLEVKTLEKHAPQLAFIPNFIDYWTEPSNDDLLDHVIVMEYIEGEPLFAAYGAPAWTADAVIEFLREMLANLGRFHQDTGLIHRDIKPHNIIRRTSGIFCIVDLGIAGRPDETILGGYSNFFSSPEQITSYGRSYSLAVDDARVGPASDLYSLGATAFYLFTREVHGNHREELSMFQSGPPATHPALQKAPSVLAQTMRELLAESPEQRPSSATQALERMRLREAGRFLEPMAISTNKFLAAETLTTA